MDRLAGGVYAAKPRPALIIQDNLFSATESVVVIPLTTTLADAAIARVAVPTTTGIAQPSFAMIDKVTTVRRSNLPGGAGRSRVHHAYGGHRTIAHGVPRPCLLRPRWLINGMCH